MQRGKLSAEYMNAIENAPLMCERFRYQSTINNYLSVIDFSATANKHV